MINEQDLKLIKYFAAATFYTTEKNKCSFKFLTSNEFICKKQNMLYDLIENKYIKKLPENTYKVIALGVPTNLVFSKLFNEKRKSVKNKFFKRYFSNIEASIYELKKFEREEIENKIIFWKNSTLEELYFFSNEEYGINLPKNITKTKAILFLKKEYLSSLRDEYPYNIRRLLNIFNLKSETELHSTDINIINTCKEAWRKLLFNRKKFTHNILKDENNDKETQEEIKQIKEEIEQCLTEFNSIDFKSPIHVSTFWPVILYPKPSFSFDYDDETKQENLSSNV
jgi:hypothetical protein